MIKFIIKGITTTLGFSKTEAKGTFILIILLVLSFVATEMYVYILKNKTTPTTDPAALQAWQEQVKSSYKTKEPSRKVQNKNFSARHFYSSSSSKKSNKTQFSTFNNEKYKKYKKYYKYDTLNRPAALLDINFATGEALIKVRGIGKILSERLIKYRNVLGGFHDLDQLNEIYGIKPETVLEVKKYFSVQSEVSKVDLNTDSIKILVRHPYINYDLAKIILNYRKQHGNFEKGNDIQKILALEDTTLKKLTPYID